MRNVVLINASPKINEEAISKNLIEMAGRHINGTDTQKIIINIRESFTRHKTKEDFEIISKADALIIAFPLYIFCMPGILTRYLQDYYQFLIENGKSSNNTKVYAVVNCGFPEPDINLEAVRVIKSFCQKISAQFRFGILIGGGGMLLQTENAPFMKKTISSLNNAFLTISKDIQSNNLEKIDNIHIAMNFPRRLYLFFGDRGWVSMARKNGLKKKELYGRPY